MTAKLSALGLPAATLIWAAVVFASVLEAGGALLLIIGSEKLGATLLSLFLVLITPVMHNPTTGDQMEQINFLKNAALLGAMQYILANQGKSSKAKTN